MSRLGTPEADRKRSAKPRLSPVWVLDLGMLCCAGAIVAVLFTAVR